MHPETSDSRRPSVGVAMFAFHGTHRRTIRRLLLALLVLEVAGIILLGRSRNWMADDAHHYLDIAANLRATHTFSVHLPDYPPSVNHRRLEPEAWRPLGYPVFLALLETVTGPRPLAIVLVQEGLFLLAVFLVGRYCARIHPGGETAFLCLVLAYPVMAEAAATPLSEGPCILLVVLGALCLQSSRARGAVAAGLLLGLAAWFRVNLFLLGTAAGLGMALLGRQRCWRRGLIVAAVSLMVVLPNSVRNDRLFGSVSPLPYVSGVGPVLYWLSLHSRGDLGDFHALVDHDTAQSEAVVAAAHGTGYLDDLASYPTIADQRTADRMMTQDAIENIRAHPGPYFAAAAANLFEIWLPPHNHLRRFPAVFAIVDAFEAAVIGLGFWGMLLAVRRPDGYGMSASFAAAAAAMCLYLPASVCWFLSGPRYIAPIGLLMLVFAALAITHWLSLFAARGRAIAEGPRMCAAAES